MKHFHPRKGDHGQPVELNSPSQPTAPSSWDDPNEIATVTPDGPCPPTLNGIAFADWIDAPTTAAGWEEQVALTAANFTEPPMTTVTGKAPASGVVILEADGRVWVVSPSNGFGGYVNTIPKGKLDSGFTLRANALKEGYEECGLRVALTGFLCDSLRSTSVTRYYTAKRIGGHPARMCWETQAVHLAPRAELAKFISHKNDQVIVQALQALN